MINTVLRKTLFIALAGTVLAGTAEARGFGGFHGGGGGGFGGRGIAVGEPNPGIPHGGGMHHGGGWGHGWGHRGFGWGFGTIGFVPSYGCYTKRFIDPFGNIVIRRFCD